MSCSDLENELAQVEGTANDNAAAIESLNSELAALKTALSAAQADADAAMAAAKAAQQAGDAAKAEAEAAKAAAEQAKAEAIAAVMAEVEAIQTAIAQNVEAITNLSGSVNANAVEIEALQEEIKALQTAAAEHVYAITNLNGSIENHEMAIEDLKTELSVLKNTLANYEKNLKDLGLLTEEFKEDIAQLTYAVTNLTTAVETNTNDIDGLKEQFEDVVASVKAVNEALVAVGNVLSALTNQIQSVVYVPETLNGLATAQGYTFGSGNSTKYTDLLVKMTYEVSPKGLASAITSENAAFSTVPVTKAAEAEYFKAQVLSADAATGRVVVYAHIPKNDKSAAYKALTDNKNNDDTTVALALNVASPRMISLLLGDEPEILDAGTYVQSAYTGVLANEAAPYQSVYNLVKWYNTEDEEFVASPATGDQVKVSWNLASSSTRNLFTNYEVRVDVDGEPMTVAEATEFFGQEVKVAYGRTAKYYSDNNTTRTEITAAAENPFTVTGTDLTTTAKFANVKDVAEDEELVNYNTDVTVNVYVNGQTATTSGATPHLSLTTNYIVIEKQASVVFADVEKAWAYSEGDEAVVPAQEVDVLTSADITDFGAFLDGATWTKVPTAEWKWKDGNNVEHKEKATATVTALSKKAVTLKFDNGATNSAMTYAQAAPATYAFSGVVTKGGVDYTVAFNVKLGAMPADKTIDLNNGQPFEINGALEKEMVIKDLTPATQSIAHIQAVDNKFKSIKDQDVATLFAGATTTIKVDGQAPTTETAVLAINKEGTGDNTKEKTTLTLDGLTKYNNTIEVKVVKVVYGVQFTYTATIVTKKPTITFQPAVAYVTSENKVNLDGTVKLPITNGVTGTKTAYALNAIDLRNYVDVTIPTNLANDFYIRYTLKENPFVKEYNANGTVKTYKDIPNSTTDPKAKFTKNYLPKFTTTAATVTENANETPSVKLVPTEKCPVDWNVLNEMREMTYEIALVSKNQIPATATVPAHDDVFASFDVTLVVPELIKTFAADEQLKVKYESGATAASTNIVSAFNIVDKSNNVIYNAYARNYEEMWHGYELNKKGELVDVHEDNFFKVYNQNIIFPAADKVKAYKGSTDVTSQVKPILNPTTGALTIKAESATLTGDIEVKVPVVLTYMYDEYGTKAKEATVSVLFTLSEDGEESGDVAIEDTPDLKQWNLGTEVYAKLFGDDFADVFPDVEGARYIFDFGLSYAEVNAKLEALGIPEQNYPRWSENTFATGVSYEDLYGEPAAGIWCSEYNAEYRVEANDPTSGDIVLIAYDRSIDDYAEVATIPYSNYNGTTCTFDIDFLFMTGEPYLVTATLVTEPVTVLPQGLF